MRTRRRLSPSRHGRRAVKTSVAALLGVMVALGACHPTLAERSIVRRWLLCEECVEGERDSVVALGDNVVKALEEALDGPPAAGRDNIRRQAEAMFARIPAPPLPEAVYVEHYVDNYVATYQSRAAIALGLIGTPRARAVLLEALRNDSAYRDDVQRDLGGSAYLSLVAADTTPQSAPADSFVRINPAVVVSDVRDAAAPHPLGNVRVVFQVVSGGGRVFDSIQRTSANGTATVRWQLGPGVDSLNVLRVVAAGQTVRFRATGRRPELRVVFAVQPSNSRRGEAIDPPVVIAIVDPWDQTASSYNGTANLNVVGAGIFVTDTVIGGVATFSDIRVNAPGTGFRLLARVGGATEAVSAPFDILP